MKKTTPMCLCHRSEAGWSNSNAEGSPTAVAKIVEAAANMAAHEKPEPNAKSRF